MKNLPQWTPMVSRLAELLDGVPPETMDFFDAILTSEPPLHYTPELAALVGLNPMTLMSRFERVGLPSPRVYLRDANLVRVCVFLEDPTRSIAEVSETLGYSSPQSFGRLVLARHQLTAKQFRMAFTGEQRFALFVAERILPYRTQLRSSFLFGAPRFITPAPMAVAA